MQSKNKDLIIGFTLKFALNLTDSNENRLTMIDSMYSNGDLSCR